VRRTPQGKGFDYRRLRNTYRVHMERLDEPAFAPARLSEDGGHGQAGGVR
jgi:hypothetical protein